MKVGITTGRVQDRIQQLYATSVPTMFRIVETYEVLNYAELEQALGRNWQSRTHHPDIVRRILRRADLEDPQLPRRMADPAFQAAQWRRRYDGPVEPINRFVDRLTQGSRPHEVPYLPPFYGGVDARLLCILTAPGPKSLLGKGGSGFICIENNDATAERLCNLLSDAGIPSADLMQWNAYPWDPNPYDEDPAPALSSRDLEAGLEPLAELLAMLPKVEVVMLLGGKAQLIWKKLVDKSPSTVESRKLVVIETFSTAARAFVHPDPLVREGRRKKLREDFSEAARHLRLRS